MACRLVLRLLLFAVLLSVPVGLAAQEEGGGGGGSALGVTVGKLQTDEQKRGDAIFHKNCHLCHIATAQKRELKINANELVGLFKRPNINEQAVRQLIQNGIPKRMPAFTYNFTAAEVDDLVAYLKIR
ncbi:MAG: cytochrome c [Acidobacteria bacterium]|nr:cytochrome c [Acidobacteriota bacterium]